MKGGWEGRVGKGTKEGGREAGRQAGRGEPREQSPVRVQSAADVFHPVAPANHSLWERPPH